MVVKLDTEGNPVELSQEIDADAQPGRISKLVEESKSFIGADPLTYRINCMIYAERITSLQEMVHYFGASVPAGEFPLVGVEYQVTPDRNNADNPKFNTHEVNLYMGAEYAGRFLEAYNAVPRTGSMILTLANSDSDDDVLAVAINQFMIVPSPVGVASLSAGCSLPTFTFCFQAANVTDLFPIGTAQLFKEDQECCCTQAPPTSSPAGEETEDG